MADNKPPKLGKDGRQHLKDEVQSLLASIGNDEQGDLVVDNELAESTRQESPYDFEQMGKVFTEKAREVTDALFKNFVDINIFDNNDYAKIKKELDTVNMSNFFFQLKTLKILIIKVMEEITSGNTAPRMIEVAGQLQDKMASITKMQANYVLFLEDTYRGLNSETPVNEDKIKVESSISEGQYFLTVGTKNITEKLSEDDVLATEKITRRPGYLVDPKQKGKLMKENNIVIDDGKSSDDFIDLTDLI